MHLNALLGVLFISYPLRTNCQQEALRNVQEVYERKYGRIEEISREVVSFLRSYILTVYILLHI